MKQQLVLTSSNTNNCIQQEKNIEKAVARPIIMCQLVVDDLFNEK